MSSNSTQSLLADAFQVLLDELGPQKTTELWQVLVSPKKDYAEIRKELFGDKKASNLYEGVRRFNRKD